MASEITLACSCKKQNIISWWEC